MRVGGGGGHSVSYIAEKKVVPGYKYCKTKR